jgi:hypothetical protein
MKAKGTFPYFIIPFPMIAIETRTSLSRFALKVAQITLSRKGRGFLVTDATLLQEAGRLRFIFFR